MSWMKLTILAIIAIISIQFHGIKNGLIYLKSNPGIAKGILLAIVIFGLIGWAIDSRAEAEYLTYTEINLGMDLNPRGSPQCATDDVNKRLASNLSITQNLARWRNYEIEYFQGLRGKQPHYKLKNTVELNIFYAHESCVFDEDQNTEDTYGFHITKRWDWK